MKIETVEKILKRYAKGLQVMENEAIEQNEPKDAERYRLDKNAMYEALKIIENGKE